MIGQLQTEGPGFDREEELRWRINQLEKDKLELSSKYNQEVMCPQEHVMCLHNMISQCQRNTSA